MIFYRGLLALLPALLFLAKPAAAQRSITRYDAVLDSLEKSGHPDAVLPYLRAELKKAPNNEAVLRTLGYRLAAAGKLDSAAALYRRALSVNPKCARCQLNLGQMAAMRGDLPEALRLTEAALALDPADPAGYSFKAALKEQTGDDLEAIIAYDRAVALAPAEAQYYLQRGAYNMRKNYASLALADLTRAVALAPGTPEPLTARAEFYNAQRRYAEALADADAALDFDSSRAGLYAVRAAAYSGLDSHTAAVEDYTRAAALASADYAHVANRSLARYALEDMDGSCEDVQAALRLLARSTAPDTAGPAGILRERSANYCDASKPSYYYQRGIALFNLGRYLDAVPVYTLGLEKFPANAMILSFRGNAHLRAGEYATALDDYGAALRARESLAAEVAANRNHLAPNNIPAAAYTQTFFLDQYNSMAECAFALGRYEEALRYADSSLQPSATIADIRREEYHHIRGLALLALGRYADADAALTECLRLQPLSAEAHLHRAMARAAAGTRTRVRITSVNAGLSGGPLATTWSLPVGQKARRPKDAEAALRSALEDCSRALSLDPKLGQAYALRAGLRKDLGEGGYCDDVRQARALGGPVGDELATDCP